MLLPRQTSEGPHVLTELRTADALQTEEEQGSVPNLLEPAAKTSPGR